MVAASATGWLYLVRPAVPGPRIGEALPLDELSRHAASPVLWYVLVWLVAGTILGLLVRRSGADRLTAAVVLGGAIGVFEYLQSSVSISVVRQISMRSALDAADTLKPVYLAAMTTAIAIAAIASPRARARRAPLLVAAAVATGGALNLFHAMLPGDDRGLLRSITPDGVGPLAHATGALLACGLLVAARGLARRRHRSWQVAVALAGLSTLLHVLHGFSHGTLVSAILVVVLLARRHDFDGPGDEATKHLLFIRLGIAAATLATYGVAALWLNRLAADQPFTAGFAAREVGRGLLGLELHGSPHLAGHFGDWYPLSLLLFGLAAVAWVLAGWLAPWRHRVAQLEREREIARSLVHAWGADTLAPFVLRRDKSYFFSDDESAFVAYRVVGGVAIVSGDPVGPADAGDDLLAHFVAHARHATGASRSWARPSAGSAYTRAHGLHALYHGDEAVVDTAAFSLEGRRDPQGAPVRAPARQCRLHDARPRTERDRRAAPTRARGGRGRVARRPAGAGLRDGARRPVRARRRGRRVRGRNRSRREGGRLPPLRDLAGRQRAFALLDAAPARHAQRFNEWLICDAIAWARATGSNESRSTSHRSPPCSRPRPT